MKATTPAPVPSLYADVHPIDLIARAAGKLHLLKNLITDDNGALTIGSVALSEGLYWMIDGVEKELDYALDRMNVN